jgi:hypothetical protein
VRLREAQKREPLCLSTYSIACKSTCGLKSLSYLQTDNTCVSGVGNERTGKRNHAGILQDHDIGGSEVDPQPSRSGTEKKDELGRPLGVELVHLRVAAFTVRVATTKTSK